MFDWGKVNSSHNIEGTRNGSFITFSSEVVIVTWTTLNGTVKRGLKSVPSFGFPYLAFSDRSTYNFHNHVQMLLPRRTQKSKS
ncbi:unnamed protein product [Lactuca virosa]|uniref:Uncharacterized protein n=1 Tax=Lactuca virosa TaxID=75947 RepID=A0AAU9MPG6_9ASTR|nr:unnamed protein product [Lactuca virosa]